MDSGQRRGGLCKRYLHVRLNSFVTLYQKINIVLYDLAKILWTLGAV